MSKVPKIEVYYRFLKGLNQPNRPNQLNQLNQPVNLINSLQSIDFNDYQGNIVFGFLTQGKLTEFIVNRA